MHDATKMAVTARLRRIEGQVGGLIRMVDEDRYCVDVLTQINAVRAALHKVEVENLSYKAAAASMGIRLENFKMVVCRARKKIFHYALTLPAAAPEARAATA